MTTARDLEYQAQYQRRRRAQARASGKSQLNVIVPGDLVAQLDGMQHARGLTNRNDALALVLREYFGRGDDERNPAVSA
jgi:metal-responsive CopG/Arc/MetJ family transcriptional regulator